MGDLDVVRGAHESNLPRYKCSVNYFPFSKSAMVGSPQRGVVDVIIITQKVFGSHISFQIFITYLIKHNQMIFILYSSREELSAK